MATEVHSAPPEIEYTVHGGWALALGRLLNAYGCDSEQMFAACNLPLAEIRDSHVRVPERNMFRLWHMAEQETGDDAFGLEIHHHITPTTFHALGLALWSSTSLHDALVRVARFGKVMSNGGVKTFEELDSSYCLSVSIFRYADGPVISYHSDDALFAALITICRSIFKPDYTPLKLERARPQPSDPGRFEAFFGCPVEFEADENRMYFDKSTIHDPLATGDSEAAEQAETLAAMRLAALEEEDIVNRVYCTLIELIPSGGVSEERTAAALGLPVHQLRRRLAEEGTRYKDILDNTRRKQALHYIGNSRFQLSEIAFLLGFSEQTNFTRAFKRWTGKTPGQYRSSPDQ